MGILYVISTLLKNSVLDILDKSLSIWIVKSLDCFLNNMWSRLENKQREEILTILEKALIELYISGELIELRKQLWKLYFSLVNKK